MSDPESWTATQLADALDRMRSERRHHHPDVPGLTAGMSRLDYAAASFCERSEEVAAAYRDFTGARYAFQTARGDYAAHWLRAADAAGRLAAALRKLGGLRACAVCGLACACGTCAGTGRVRSRRGGRVVEDCPHCSRRQQELRVLNLADELAENDDSLAAQCIREVAHSIRADYDPEQRDRVIWGGAAAPWVGVRAEEIGDDGRWVGPGRGGS